MLEARDRMSRPLQQAARSSQNLQNRVTRLSGALNRSRSSVVNASVSARILSERYRELGRRIAGADEKVKTSVKLFRSLPAPIRLAAYTLEGYAKALYNVIAKNTLARITTKVLVTSFRTLYTVTWNLTNYLKQAVKAMWNFSKLGYVVKGLVYPFKMAALGAKTLTMNMLRAAKQTFTYQLLKTVVKDLAGQIRLAALSQKTFIKDLPHIVKGTRAWQMYAYAVQTTKTRLREGYLAFNLWKNASPTVEKIANKFKILTNAVGSFKNALNANIQGMQRLGDTAARTGNRGRATFNQLADANARLNREIAKLNNELNKANSRLGKMKTSIGSLNGVGLAFAGAYAGQAAYGAGERFTKSTVGRAMEQQYSSASVGILAGAENGAKFYKQIQDYAATTAYSTEDWARNMRGAISKSKSVEDLKVYQTAMEQLATLDPIQGLDGAALAIRELNSGDIVSLVERFELPRGALKEIKNISDPIEQTNKLIELVGENTGYTVENLQKMKELPLMQWQKLTNSAKTMMGYIGAGALEKLAPYFEKLNKMWDDGYFKGFIDKMSEGLANITTKLIGFATTMSTAFSGKNETMQPFIEMFGNIKNSLSEAWPTIQGIFSNFASIASQTASTVNSMWPQVNTVLQTALGIIKSISGWIANNWSTILPIITGVAAGLATFKIAVTVTSWFMMLKKGIDMFRAGTLLARIAATAFFTVLRMNPIGLIVSLIIALGVALYTAYHKNETFRNAVQKCFNWLKGVGAAAVNTGKKAIEGLKSAFEKVKDAVAGAYEKFKNFVSSVKNFKMPSFKIPFFGGGGDGGNGRGASGGLNYVPYDGFHTRLHKGERVLTREENKEYNRSRYGGGGGVNVTGNTFIVRKESDIDAIAEALANKLYSNKVAMGG